MISNCYGAIVYNEDKFLIIKYPPYKGGHWSFPKGHQENGESVYATAIREVKEETGIDILIKKEFKEQSTQYMGKKVK